MTEKELRKERFVTGFKTYDNNTLLSNIKIDCKNYKTFTTLVETIQEILSGELEEKKEIKPQKLEDDILDMTRHFLYKYYTPSLIAQWTDNIYHRTCNQLESYLKKNNINCTVSRSSVGEQSYYNLDFKIDDSEHQCSIDYKIKKLLDINGVGLVDFNKIDGVIYKTILVDEKELNDKYLVNGNLKF